LLTESLLLAVAAGTVGTALAYASLPAILSLVPPGTIPDESEIAINLPVLVFTLMVTFAASIVCGLAPALHASRRDYAGAMREAGRTLAGASGHARLRKSIVVAEIALSLVLLAGSSALLHAFVALQRVQLDMPPDRVLTMRCRWRRSGIPTRRARSRSSRICCAGYRACPASQPPASTPACIRSAACGRSRRCPDSRPTAIPSKCITSAPVTSTR
jgi:hypothetical protein